MDKINPEIIRAKISPVINKYHMASVGLFGSRARGNEHSDSDYDFVVRFKETPSLVELIRLEHELEEILKARVDLVIEGSEKPFIKEFIKRDLPELKKALLAF